MYLSRFERRTKFLQRTSLSTPELSFDMNLSWKAAVTAVFWRRKKTVFTEIRTQNQDQNFNVTSAKKVFQNHVLRKNLTKIQTQNIDKNKFQQQSPSKKHTQNSNKEKNFSNKKTSNLTFKQETKNETF